MTLDKLKKWFQGEETEEINSTDEFYDISNEDAFKDLGAKGGKMVLLEPRAFSESQQIADHLKARRSVVVNLKRVTKEHAKRIVDFLSGTVYAIGGDIQKLGEGIFLFTPKNISVEGEITVSKSSEEE